MIFAVSFLGALFAILTSLLVVYSYVMLRLFPRLKRGLREFVEEIGPRAVFERANVDPAEAMQQLGIVSAKPSPVAVTPKDALRVIFTCEDHGRCAGCPKVLAQFEAIVKHQGAESFDDVERTCYEMLRTRLVDFASVQNKEHAV